MWLAMGLLLSTGTPLAAQHLDVEALGSVVATKTDAGSQLLALNAGNPMLGADMYTWIAIEPSSTLRIMALGEIYGTTAADSRIEAELQLLSLRWWRSRAVRVEAGRILLPLGEFASRRFANVNPLIGMPDTYVDEYPWGASFSGAIGAIDYLVAGVSLPAVNERYTPSPGRRLRPVVGIGVSAGPGWHLGLAITHGPYLNADLNSQLPTGASWQDFAQTVATADLRFSAGRLDTRGEAAWSSYEVPTATDAVHGLGWYLESRMSVSPRLFVAARYEDNRYAFVMPLNPQFWIGTATTQMNGELGLGYRLSPDALVKASLRKDHWPVHDISGTSFPDGYAIAAQVSMHADLVQLLTRRP
jgi:hypothetical protein